MSIAKRNTSTQHAIRAASRAHGQPDIIPRLVIANATADAYARLGRIMPGSILAIIKSAL
jgi:hypothetical protein